MDCRRKSTPTNCRKKGSTRSKPTKLGFPPDLRDYGLGAQILFDLGVRKMRFLTNNPKKVVGLEGYGLKIVEVVPIKAPSNPHNARYLETKRVKLGPHSLTARPLARAADTCCAVAVAH